METMLGTAREKTDQFRHSVQHSPVLDAGEFLDLLAPVAGQHYVLAATAGTADAVRRKNIADVAPQAFDG